MSSAGRGAEREELDGYWTPQPCADAIVARLLHDAIIGKQQSVLEPSAGKGAFVRAILQQTDPDSISVCDLVWRPELLDIFGEGEHVAPDESFTRDFLTIEPENYYDLVIGNPPFNDAERHVRKALTLIDPETGVLAFILRLSMLEGVDRQAHFWKEHPCQYIYVLDRRPSFSQRTKQAKDSKSGELLFNKDGSPKMITVKNDSAAYAVFVWAPGHNPPPTMGGIKATMGPVVRFLSWSER